MERNGRSIWQAGRGRQRTKGEQIMPSEREQEEQKNIFHYLRFIFHSLVPHEPVGCTAHKESGVWGRRRKSSCGKKLKIKKEKSIRKFMFAFKAFPPLWPPPTPLVCSAPSLFVFFPSHRTMQHKYLVTKILNFFGNSPSGDVCQ